MEFRRVLFRSGAKLLSNGAVARLNPDGSLDSSFAPDGQIELNQAGSLAEQPDGKLLVAAQNGPGETVIVCFNSDGSSDLAFSMPSGGFKQGDYPAAIPNLLLQPDGQIVVAGQFDEVGGIPRSRLARLNGRRQI